MGRHNVSATSNKSAKMQLRQSNGRLTMTGVEIHQARCGTCRGLVNMTEAVVVGLRAFHRRHAPKENAA